MQLNLRKIDEHIQRLQEVRRIAADPELVAMLFEFVSREDERPGPISEPAGGTVLAAGADAVGAPRLDDADVVNRVVKGSAATGSGLWSGKRA